MHIRVQARYIMPSPPPSPPGLGLDTVVDGTAFVLEQVRTRRPLHLPARSAHPRDRLDELSRMCASPTLFELHTRRSLTLPLTGTRDKKMVDDGTHNSGPVLS